MYTYRFFRFLLFQEFCGKLPRNVSGHMYTHICMYVCIYVFMYVYIYTHTISSFSVVFGISRETTTKYLWTCVYKCMHVCMCVCIHVYTYHFIFFRGIWHFAGNYREIFLESHVTVPVFIHFGKHGVCKSLQLLRRPYLYAYVCICMYVCPYTHI